MHQLNPELKKDKWSSEDSIKLFELHRSLKNKWKNIAEQFPGRTDNSIKNQFFSVVRKALRKACKILGNYSNTSAINRIKPKVLSNYMAMDFEVNANEGSNGNLKISLNQFVQKFAFTKYDELTKSITSTDITVIKQCIDYLNRLNESYMRKKMSKAQVAKDTYSDMMNGPCYRLTDNKLKYSTNFTDPINNPSDFNQAGQLTDAHLANNFNSVDEINRKFQDVLSELGDLNQADETFDEKLTIFFKELGNFSFNVARMLSTKEDSAIKQPMLQKIVEIANKARFLLKNDIKPEGDDGRALELHKTPGYGISERNKPIVVQTNHNSCSEIKNCQMIHKTSNKRFNIKNPLELSIHKPLNEVEIPKPAAYPNIRSVVNKNNQKLSPDRYPEKNNINGEQKFPDFLLKLKGYAAIEPQLNKRNSFDYNDYKEVNDQSKYMSTIKQSIYSYQPCSLVDRKGDISSKVKKRS